jgi:hypothetical protein
VLFVNTFPIYMSNLTLHFTSALRAKLPKPNTPRKAPTETMPCSWRLVEMVVSRNAGGQNPVELNHEFTLSQNSNWDNDPTIL